MEDEYIYTSAALLHPARAAARAGGGIVPVDLTIFISAFNEENYLPLTLNEVQSALEGFNGRYEIIIIDDGSSDNTDAVIRDLLEKNQDKVIVYRRNAVNKGLANNYLDAAFIGEGRYFRMVCGDNVEPRETLKAVFDAIGSADLVIPYHAHLQGKPLRRKLLSRAYVWLVNILSGNDIRYYNGLPAIPRLDVMRYPPTTSGFGFQAEIICKLLNQGRSYIEVPVSAVETKASTALNIRNVLSVLHVFLNILVQRISSAYHARGRR